MIDRAAIVLGAGQRIDRSHRADFLPEALEPVVRHAVRTRLIELGAATTSPCWCSTASRAARRLRVSPRAADRS